MTAQLLTVTCAQNLPPKEAPNPMPGKPVWLIMTEFPFHLELETTTSINHEL